jgi:hypothetical protein
MPVRAVRAGADFVEINNGGKIIRATEADLWAGNKKNTALAFQGFLQKGLDVIQVIADLPADDPDKTTDPKLARGERMFWGDSDGKIQANPSKNDQLVSRSVIVESVTWDGTVYVPALRRARI